MFLLVLYGVWNHTVSNEFKHITHAHTVLCLCVEVDFCSGEL